MSLITVDRLSAYYENKEVFSDLSFSIEKGDYICIIGENGSGKTTLMRCILGFNVKHNGYVLLGGLQRSQIGWLPQRGDFKDDFPASVEEVIYSGFGGGIFGLRITAAQKKTAQENMKLLEIDGLKSSAFSELSGGQQQKVLLCRAMCSANKILLLDEPVTGLDSASQNELYEIIKTLNLSGITIIMISHDINRSIKNADKILHLGQNGYFFGKTQDYLDSDFYFNSGVNG